MVARLTPDQEVACSNHVEINMNCAQTYYLYIFRVHTHVAHYKHINTFSVQVSSLLGVLLPYCLVVRIPGSPPGGPGVIPGLGICILVLLSNL
jgi:hypothetical protein